MIELDNNAFIIIASLILDKKTKYKNGFVKSNKPRTPDSEGISMKKYFLDIITLSITFSIEFLVLFEITSIYSSNFKVISGILLKIHFYIF